MWRFTLTSPRDVQLNFTNLPSSARWQVYQGCGGTPQGAGAHRVREVLGNRLVVEKI